MNHEGAVVQEDGEISPPGEQYQGVQEPRRESERDWDRNKDRDRERNRRRSRYKASSVIVIEDLLLPTFKNQNLDRNQQKNEEEGIETRKEAGVVSLDQVVVVAEVVIAEGEVAVGIVVKGIVKDLLTSNFVHLKILTGLK